jgi:hypothetical protein
MAAVIAAAATAGKPSYKINKKKDQSREALVFFYSIREKSKKW